MPSLRCQHHNTHTHRIQPHHRHTQKTQVDVKGLQFHDEVLHCDEGLYAPVNIEGLLCRRSLFTELELALLDDVAAESHQPLIPAHRPMHLLRCWLSKIEEPILMEPLRIHRLNQTVVSKMVLDPRIE